MAATSAAVKAAEDTIAATAVSDMVSIIEGKERPNESDMNFVFCGNNNSNSNSITSSNISDRNKEDNCIEDSNVTHVHVDGIIDSESLDYMDVDVDVDGAAAAAIAAVAASIHGGVMQDNGRLEEHAPIMKDVLKEMQAKYNTTTTTTTTVDEEQPCIHVANDVAVGEDEVKFIPMKDVLREDVLDTQEKLMSGVTSQEHIEVHSNNDDNNNDNEVEFVDDGDDDGTLYCTCRKPQGHRRMICCDTCDDWFHLQCVKMTKKEADRLQKDDKEYICPRCVKDKPSPPILTTVDRQSKRRRIDKELPAVIVPNNISSTTPPQSQPPPVVSVVPAVVEGTPVTTPVVPPAVAVSNAPKEPKARSIFRDNLEKKLMQRAINNPDNKTDKGEHKNAIESEVLRKLAKEIEYELFSFCGCGATVGKQYSNKGRSLLFNLGDPRNHLFRRVVSGELTPHVLVRLTVEQLATKELAEWRQAEHTSTLKDHVLETANVTVITKKTHKGDVTVNASDDQLLFTSTEERENSGSVRNDLHEGEASSSSDNDKYEAPIASNKAAVIVDHIINDKTPDDEEKTASASANEDSRFDGNPTSDGTESRRNSIMRPAYVPATGAPDTFSVDENDNEDDNFGPYSPTADVLSDSDCFNNDDIEDDAWMTSIWNGSMLVPHMASVSCDLCIISGNSEGFSAALGNKIDVLGRIREDQMVPYISGVRKTLPSRLSVCILKPAVGNVAAADAYDKVFTYLMERKRCGVVVPHDRCGSIKDLYIVPVAHDDELPSWIIEGRYMLKNRETNILIAVMVRCANAPTSPTSTQQRQLQQQKEAQEQQAQLKELQQQKELLQQQQQKELLQQQQKQRQQQELQQKQQQQQQQQQYDQHNYQYSASNEDGSKPISSLPVQQAQAPNVMSDHLLNFNPEQLSSLTTTLNTLYQQGSIPLPESTPSSSQHTNVNYSAPRTAASHDGVTWDSSRQNNVSLPPQSRTEQLSPRVVPQPYMHPSRLQQHLAPQQQQQQQQQPRNWSKGYHDERGHEKGRHISRARGGSSQYGNRGDGDRRWHDGGDYRRGDESKRRNDGEWRGGNLIDSRANHSQNKNPQPSANSHNYSDDRRNSDSNDGFSYDRSRYSGNRSSGRRWDKNERHNSGRRS